MGMGFVNWARDGKMYRASVEQQADSTARVLVIAARALDAATGQPILTGPPVEYYFLTGAELADALAGYAAARQMFGALDRVNGSGGAGG